MRDEVRGRRLHISYVMKQADPLRPGGIEIGADRAIEMAVDGVTARGATWSSSCDRQWLVRASHAGPARTQTSLACPDG